MASVKLRARGGRVGFGKLWVIEQPSSILPRPRSPCDCGWQPHIFAEVMDLLPYEDLWAFLNNPEPITNSLFMLCLSAWMSPRKTSATIFIDAALDSKIHSPEAGLLLPSKSIIYRKVKEGALRWNGEKVRDAHMPIAFLAPGWGVVTLGKTNHAMILQEK